MTVTVIGTGGTIASATSPDNRRTADMELEEVVRAVPELAARTDLRFQTVVREGSYNLTDGQMLDIATAAVKGAEDPECEGVVVSHGTDTMAETGYLIDLMHAGEKPIIMTGAQVPLSEPHSDGGRNLIDSVTLAREPQARGLGALVCMGGRVDDARTADKDHTASPRPFRSTVGPLGEVIDGCFLLYRRRLRPPTLSLVPEFRGHVALLHLYAGITAPVVRGVVDAGVNGLVLEAFGMGNASRHILGELQRAREREIPLVVSSRCFGGNVRAVYGDGGGRDLVDAGALLAGVLPAAKARILLAVALSSPAVNPPTLNDSLVDILAPHLHRSVN